MAVGALEPQFYAELLERLELDPDAWPQHDRSRWPAYHQRLAAVFAGRTRDEWERVFDGSDACVAPVLSLREAPKHAHNVERGAFVEHAGVVQPAAGAAVLPLAGGARETAGAARSAHRRGAHRGRPGQRGAPGGGRRRVVRRRLRASCSEELRAAGVVA